MGYYVRFLRKQDEPQWKVQFITYKREHVQTSGAKKPRKDWDVPKKRWPVLGFHSAMRLDEARARATQLNAEIELKRQEEKRKQIENEMTALNLKFTANLPDVFKTEFELKYIRSRYADTAWEKRTLTSWRAAQQMLIEISLDPMQWHDEAYRFYDYFHRKRFSFSYIKKILLITNLWGHFLSRKLGQSFMNIPQPRGKEKARLIDAYFQKSGGRLNQSDPLTPAQLEEGKSKLKRLHLQLALSLCLAWPPSPRGGSTYGSKTCSGSNRRKAVGINLSHAVIDYFKKLSIQSGIPYQMLIDLYLLDCVKRKKKIKLDWAA